MEDPLVTEFRKELKQVYARQTEILILLRGNPTDGSKGMLGRLDEMEKWRQLLSERDRRLKIWGAAIIGVGGFAIGIFKIIQSIMK